MASLKHESLLLLFRNRPELAPQLLGEVLGLPLPRWTEARVESADLTEVVPAEYRADLVVLLLEGKPCFAIVVEVQLSRDEDKRGSWPPYLTNLRSRVNCPTALLVVAPDAAVARWCAQPIELGHPGFVLKPLVLGPDSIPIVVEEAVAREAPELAVLSAMAHGNEEVGAAIASTVLAAVAGLEGERIRLYVDLVLGSLSQAARGALEALMMSGKYEYQSEFARHYVAQGREEGREEGLQQGRGEGLQQGLQRGREEGREEGLQKGREEGLHEGERAALFEVLAARGLVVEEQARQRILACLEPEQLKRWLRKAVSARTTEELFEP
jgi:flagellar biosynthesis/type III secretory pathway protein FliH